MLYTVIKGGKIIDGLGGQPYVGDVSIKDGVIVEIGDDGQLCSDAFE